MKLPQLSLRELFLLVVIAALGCGWWVDHQRCEEGWRAAAYNFAWASNVLERRGYTMFFKRGRVSDIQPHNY